MEPETLIEMLFFLKAEINCYLNEGQRELLERILVKAKSLEKWSDEVSK